MYSPAIPLCPMCLYGNLLVRDAKGLASMDNTEVTSIEQLKGYIGQEIAVSPWLLVTQEMVDRFADATGDHQFIHVDPERAKETPFGGTIAHGYYTLSLAPKLSDEIMSFEGFAFGVNYGLNRVRFPAPLPVGQKVRMRATLASVDEIPGGVQATLNLTFEVEGGEKPVCVAESLVRLYGG